MDNHILLLTEEKLTAPTDLGFVSLSFGSCH